MESSYPPLSKHSYDGEIPYGCHGDKTSKLHAENEYLKERVKSCEKGLSGLFQLLAPKPAEEPPRVLSHYRSASLTMRSRSNSHSTPSPIPESQSRKTSESKKEESKFRVVTFSELKEAIVKVVMERDRVAEELEDHRQITEAAKRERLLAIDEKDHLLKESHELRTALDKVAGKLREVDMERKDLANHIKDLEKDINILRRTNEESMRLRSIALEERSKIIDDYSQLQNELTSLQNERSELLDEILQLQSNVSQLTNENRALSQRTTGSHCYTPVPKGTREHDDGGVRVNLLRMTPGQPWGFSVEGGRGSEYYQGDPSIVVSAVMDNTPAHGMLFTGDRLLSIGGKELRNVAKREALELIRSCDQVSVDVRVNRVTAILKPVPKEVKIPGKKTFGFTYESRVFVSGVEPESPAAGVVAPGDEITQVMGKPAVNMKQSVMKQLLKNCKDGVTMTIQSPGCAVSNANHRTPSKKQLRYSSDSSYSQGAQYQKRTSGEVPHSSNQAPGTPGSSVSETSAGYHSLTHSMPSILSNNLSPVAMDTKTGHTGLEPVGPDPRIQSQLATYQEEDSETSDSETPPSSARYRSGSAAFVPSRPRPINFQHSRRATLGHTPSHGSQPTYRMRTTSQTSYGPSEAILTSPRGFSHHPPLTPGAETTPPMPNYRYKGTSLPRGLRPPDHALSQGHAPLYDHFASYRQQRKQVISVSADNLDSDSLNEPHPPSSHHPRISRTVSHGNHMMRTSSHDVSHAGHRTSAHDISQGGHMARTPSRDCHMMPFRSVPSRRPISMSMGSMTNV